METVLKGKPLLSKSPSLSNKDTTPRGVFSAMLKMFTCRTETIQIPVSPNIFKKLRNYFHIF